MPNGKPTVLIVDDSRTVRQLIRFALSRDSNITVVGEAADPYEAREAIKALDPDVITLDVEMPRMTGTQFLEKIMKLRPMPVVMLSTLTKRGSDVAIEALSAGAVDCLGKPDKASDIADGSFADSLCRAIHTASSARMFQKPPRVEASKSTFEWNGRMALIGASTGGVDAIEQVLDKYPTNCPPTAITQHMPATFLASFAERLNARYPFEVRLAEDGIVPRQGQVFLAPGGDHHLAITGTSQPRLHLEDGPLCAGHRPSVDRLFTTGAKMGNQVVGAILTGMGRDGAEGMKVLHDAGASTIGQDKDSSVVYGMPRAAFELGGVQKQLPLGSIGQEILSQCAQSSRGRLSA